MNWSREEVDERLLNIMKDIHAQCVKYGTDDSGYIDYVKGANIAGFVKVADAMIDQFKLNTVGPSLVLKHAMRLLPRKGRAIFAALSARVGSIGDNSLGGWYSYRTSKAALNQMLHGAAIELGRTHKDLICVALHPGTVETAFTEKYAANHPTVPADKAAENLLSVLDGLTPDHSGGFFDWQGKEVPW